MRGETSGSLAIAIWLVLLAGCARPPVLTPRRIADRGIAPLARTAEVQLRMSAMFEKQHAVIEENGRRRPDDDEVFFNVHSAIAYGFTDSLAIDLPAALLWSPVSDVEGGSWLTIGGGIYGFAFEFGEVAITDRVGVSAKQRFGSAFWLSGGLVAQHRYDSSAGEDWRVPRSENVIWLFSSAEAGLQLANGLAVTLLAFHAEAQLGSDYAYSGLRGDLVLVPAWWLDVGVQVGAIRHMRETLHLDPQIGLSATARW